jgi:hypothetical protein
MNRFSIVCCTWVFVALPAFGQSEASSQQQAYRVVVPTSATVSAPGAAELVHDESNSNQSFQPQTWTVKGNTPAGVTVSFATSGPFVNTQQPTFRRDVGLSLRLLSTAGAASWQVTQPTSKSSYEAGQEVASVAAVSGGVGRADFALTVDFITGSFGTFATGEYSTTVVGTVVPQ